MKNLTKRAVLQHCTALVLPTWWGHAAKASTKPAVIMVVGDSLSAEYGLARGTGWVELLKRTLAPKYPQATVVNASISGDTTASGRSRLEPLLKLHMPTITVIALGANDGLRGLPISVPKTNLTAMVRSAQKNGAQVLLLGMQVPPNYGRQYSTDFSAIYPLLAKQEGAALVPFFLKGVADADDPAALFQTDMLHPNASAQPLLLNNVWTVLIGMMAEK
jgi:acyl-CoA thioesterase I